MEELKRMLEEKYPAIDFDSEKSLVTDGILDSIEVVTIISEIEDMFDDMMEPMERQKYYTTYKGRKEP